MKKTILTFLIITTFFSCNKIILSLITPNNVEKSLKILKNDNQTIVFLPMVHLAKPSFYADSKKIIDSLKKENYSVFYEEIKINEKFYSKNLDSINKKTLDTLLRKFRKLLGDFRASDLTNKSNKSLPNFYKNKKYVTQTKELLGIDSLDINADTNLTELIKAHESENGEIILSECDYTTGFFEKYKCEKVANNHYAIRTFRDSIVTNKVLDFNKKNSLIIYGKAHWYMIWADLRDAGFILEEK